MNVDKLLTSVFISYTYFDENWKKNKKMCLKATSKYKVSLNNLIVL